MSTAQDLVDILKDPPMPSPIHHLSDSMYQHILDLSNSFDADVIDNNSAAYPRVNLAKSPNESLYLHQGWTQVKYRKECPKMQRQVLKNAR